MKQTFVPLTVNSSDSLLEGLTLADGRLFMEPL